MDKPKSIFRYEGFNILSLQNLKAQSIYFASPKQFNDPYDCAITAALDDTNTQDFELVRNRYMARFPEYSEPKSQLISMSDEEFKAMVLRVTSEVLSKSKDQFLSKNGVSCFSENNDDLLMWAHYGGRYKGFCLEFDTTYEPFSKLYKVKYVHEIPKIKIGSFYENEVELIRDLYCTKSKSWEYEKEWRCIHQNVQRFTYEAAALKAVYFGPDIEQESLEIICLILRGQNPNVEYWRGQKSKERFNVEFEKFPYIPHVIAKHLGLL
jgi:Protein of unknown function (DUF2971)